ncbi:reverse transcriptase domain-containing protein [Tanacetum coccineum]|uniref:Reverse transcriptase domain-containing protein n=1 Tax=Tanacetum coccineum TaxID=301880 RepID=A0ABQ5F7H8_9ASTR
MQKKSENFVWRTKRNYDRTFKNQASAIKTIEKNLGRIAESIHDRGLGTLPSFTETNPRGLAHAITTRSGLNYQPSKNPLEDRDGPHNITIEQIPTTEKITHEQTYNSTQKLIHLSLSLVYLKKEKENEQFQKFLRNLQQIHINIPFIEALEQMPKYAKFMKDLLSKKRKGSEASKIILNEQCSVVILNKVPHKEKDPGGFTIPYVIGQSGITKALADLGASISLMPYSMFLRLNLGDLKPTRMCIELANKTTQFPKGIAENVMVKIYKFIFPVDFVILDMKEDHRIPIILGRPFLATAHARIDVFNKKISFEVGDEIITFDLEESMRFPPSNEDTYHTADIIDLSVLPEIHEDDDNPTLFAANSIDDEKTTPKLKELPSHLEYAFLDNNCELPVIISSLLSEQEKWLLLEVLTKHKKALAWKISDIKGIRNEYYFFLDGFSGYFQIPLAPEDQENTTFTYPYGMFAYRRMPFGNVKLMPRLRCMKRFFHGIMCPMYKNEYSLMGKMQFYGQRRHCLSQEISKAGIEVDKAKVDVIASLPYPTNVKAVDYVSKWVEAEALPTNDARVVVRFLKKLFSRFRVSKALISNRGTHFWNSLLKKTLKKYGVTHRLATPYHPQTSRETENTNRAIKGILERTVNGNKKEWADKLDDALWAFKTAYKTPIDSTPFWIVYGKACYLPIELEHKAYWALKT